MAHIVLIGLRAIAAFVALFAAAFGAGFWRASRIERAYMRLEEEVAGPGLPA